MRKAPEDDEASAPKLVMPSDMVMTFFTRLRLHLANIEEETKIQEKESHGIVPEQFNKIADKLRNVMEREIEGIQRSYMRSVLIYEEKRRNPEAFDDAVWALLVDGPAKQRIKMEANSVDSCVDKHRKPRSHPHPRDGATSVSTCVP